MPAVSVVTPAHNVEQYLEDAARSALGQTYGDLELIICDDGSTDRTLEVARRVQETDPDRVRVLSRPNGGPSSARNACLAVARGDYIALLDGDDIWEPNFLASQVAELAARPDVDLVTTNGRYLGSRLHGRPVRPHPDRRPAVTLSTIISDECAVFVMTLFRRRVFDTIGGFDESLRGNEDFDYWMRAALAGFRFHRNSEPLAWYRRRDDSLSSNAVRMLTGAIRVCRKLRPQLIHRPELALLDRQIAYYETELCAARVRAALSQRNVAAAADALDDLHERHPTARTAVAGWLARHAAPLLGVLYQLKQVGRA